MPAPPSPASAPPERVGRWALLVGISAYAQRRLELRFAARDAARLRETLLEPSAGAFPADQVLALVDQQATLANLNKALRTFLKRPGPNDLVLLFFACHGVRDPERPDNLYLLPHDADPADVSGSGLPMREIDLALRETLHSRRVVVLVDACHSGGLGDAFAGLRAPAETSDDLNQYLARLSQSRGGVSLMTSAMANESSVEDARWGEGHGVFTHFLLEGLRGKADRPPRDGVITVGELFDYVAANVEQATGSRQHPHIGAGADRELPLAVVGAVSAAKHDELARRLAEAAGLTGEATCWRGAAVQMREADRLRGGGVTAARGVERALAWWRAGEADEALKLLARLDRDAPGVRTALGLIELAIGRHDDAKATLLAPTPAEPWAASMFDAGPGRGRRLALLVAADSVDPAMFGGWKGELQSPVAEARAFAQVLHERFGFDDTRLLLDRDATVAALRAELAERVARSEGTDAIVVLLSGHGSQIPAAEGKPALDSTFVCWDGQITSAEVDALLRGSRALRTTIVVSAAHSGAFADRAAAGGYECMTSCAAKEVDYDGPQFSVFMGDLLAALALPTDGKALAAATRSLVTTKFPTQTPQFRIDPMRPPFIGSPGDAAVGFDAQAAQVLLGVTESASTATLELVAARLGRGEAPSAVAAALATEWWQRRAWQAIVHLPAAMPLESASVACGVWAAAARHAGGPDAEAALGHLASRPALAGDVGLADELRALASRGLGSGSLARVRVLLVGLTRLADGTRGVASAADQVAAVHSALRDAGLDASQFRVLLDAQATRRAVRRALAEHDAAAPGRALFVYWCGPGEWRALPCHDGRPLEPADFGGADTTVVAEGVARGPTLHSVRRMDAAAPPLVLLAPPGAPSAWRARLDGRPGKARYGALTVALVEALRRGDAAALAPAALETASGAPLAPNGIERAHLFANPLADAVDRLVERVARAELAFTADALARLLEQNDRQDPELQLQLGVLRSALGDADVATAALESALRGFEGRPRPEALARLALGRTLLASGRDRARAVSECRRASQLDPALAAAKYWLGHAIAELVRHETTGEARAALLAYVDTVAAGGRREQALELLRSLPSS